MTSYVLISVSDKTNVEIIASHYIEMDYHVLSTGGTYKYLLDRLPEYRENIILLALAKRLGQSACLLTAIKHSTHDIIITLDSIDKNKISPGFSPFFFQDF